MTVSNANKQAVCKKYRVYLEVIYMFGNKVMLMKQLYRYAELLGIAKSFSTFYSSITELVNADILRKESFNAFGKKTQLQMLVMRKYSIRFLEQKPDSYSVASVKKALGNERILVSIFKNQYIINKIFPRIQRRAKEVTLETINKMLKYDRSSIIHNKNQGLSFLLKMRDDGTLQGYLDIVSIDQDIEKMREIKKKMEEGLRKGSKTSEGKGRGRLHSPSISSIDDIEIVAKRNNIDLNKEEKIDNYTIDTLLAFNAHIAQIKIINNRVNVTVLIFDIYNRQNIYRTVTHIACMYNMFNRYFNCEFLLKIGIVSIDQFASKNLKAQAETTVRDFVSKEVKGTRLSSILRDWHVNELMQNHIEVQFTDYNITNEFLDGIKHANLLRRY